MDSFSPLISKRDNLNEREKDLTLILDNISEGYWIWFVKEDYEYMSPRFWEIFGFRPEEKKHHPSEWQALVFQEDLPLLYQKLTDHINSKGRVPFELDVRYHHKDGSTVWVSCKGKVVEWDAEGKPVRVVGTHRDITLEKKIQNIIYEISDLRARYIEFSSEKQKFFQHLLDRVLSLTESEYGFIGEIKELNEGKYLKTYWLTDISWDEGTRKFYEENAPKGFLFKNLQTLFGQVIRTGEPLLTNTPMEHPSSGGIPKGHPPLNAFMGVPIYYSGKFIAMVGVANRGNGYNDELLKLLNPYFEVIGEMIHAKLIDEELQNQINFSMHQSRLASIGLLAAGVGHEINNPLTIISGQLFLLENYLIHSHRYDDDAKKRFVKMNNSIERISNIVKGLKTFSRNDDAELKHFNIPELIKETMDMMVDIYKKEGVDLTLSSDNKPSYILGSRGRIQQVLVNLISNAKDATLGKSERKIDLNLKSDDEAIIISVADNGSGIPNDIKDKIFDPFFTTKEINKGTGIGLSIVNNIIKDHKGKIELVTEMGVGTQFIISLPATQATESLEIAKESSTQKKIIKFKKTILVVDDEADIRDFLNDVLTEFCENIILASDGMDAVNVLENKKIDLIISDIKMPRLDGFKLLDFTVNHLGEKRPKFLFISGGVDLTPVQDEMLSKFSHGVIQKPFNVDDIKRTIFELFPEI
jgi:PAS domain S-box-containing protein